jgi:hypothetical protein
MDRPHSALLPGKIAVSIIKGVCPSHSAVTAAEETAGTEDMPDATVTQEAFASPSNTLIP